MKKGVPDGMRTSMEFNRGWRFGKIEGERPDPAQPFAGEEISLPHTWYADGDCYRGEALYRKRFARRTGESLCVKVYSKLPALTLRCGELTLHAVSDSGVFRFENVPLSPSGSLVTVSGGGCEDRALFTQIPRPSSLTRFSAFSDWCRSRS